MAGLFDNLSISPLLDSQSTGFTNTANSFGSSLGSNSSLSGLSLDNSPSMLQYGQLGLGAVNGLLSGYLGLNNLSLAKSQAAQAQNNWNKQWDANVKTTNAALSDRQAARVASNPNAYESVDSYMKKYGIS